MRIRARWGDNIIFAVLLLFPMAGTFAATPSTAHQLHTAILKEYDARKYPEASRLLNKMKAEEPERYASLPYALLHARTLLLSKNPREAFTIYEKSRTDQRVAPFVLLPLARIAANQGVANTAVHYYQQYLQHAYPEYISVAREALEYCWQLKKADLLYSTATVVQNSSTLDRLAQLYLGRAYVLRGDKALAKNLFQNLINYKKKDDVTNLALSELDLLEGAQISSVEKRRRGRLAYDVWNFDLTRKYLAPVANQSMESGCYYARALSFLGDFENSKKAFHDALALWPHDPNYSQCLYQYSNLYLREGNYQKAAELYKQLKGVAKGELQDTATFKMIYALRAQSRFADALQAVEPYTRSRNLTLRGQALLLKGRIHFQMGRHKDALADFQQALTLKPFRNHKELMLWKGMTLEKIQRVPEARTLFASLANGNDFYSHKARERISTKIRVPEKNPSSALRLPQLPDASNETAILSEYASGNIIPAFLYLRLYDDAAQELPDLNAQTWKILGVDATNRMQKFLAIAYLGGLGGNYSTATYYSELFLKNLSGNLTLFSLSPEIQKTLFPIPYKKEVEQFSRERKLDPFLVLSIMKQESKFKRFARSQAFARGLMQIIPSTASRLAEMLGLQNFQIDQLYEPEININLGTRYVQEIIKEFGNEAEFIAAGYNGGEPNVRRWRDGSIPNETVDFVSSIDFKETKNYVMIVKSNYETYKVIYGESSNGQTGSSSQP
jgi:soluble lytic murein transglycosylase